MDLHFNEVFKKETSLATTTRETECHIYIYIYIYIYMVMPKKPQRIGETLLF